MHRITECVWRVRATVTLLLAVLASSALAASSVTIAVTGDVYNAGKSKGNATRVSNAILAQAPLDAVLLVGDTCNDSATPVEKYRQLYKGTFDRLFPKVFPCPGNHDRLSVPPFSGYREFWGPLAHAPEMYYSFNLGNWHVVSLDSVTFRDDQEAADKQLAWLKQDLAASSNRHVIAYWHYPFFSQAKHGGTKAMRRLWTALAEHGPALVFNGHNHVYERYAPLDADGQPVEASKGIQEFVIGPAGGGVVKDRRPDIPAPASTVFHGDAHHVGFFTLHEDGAFDFAVKAVDATGGTTIVDQGSGKVGMN